MSQETIKQLRTWIAEQGLDALLITQPQNRSYISGWLSDDTESGSMLLVSQQQQILMTNPLFAEIAEKEATGWEIAVPEGREYAPALATLAQKHGWRTIGFESNALTYGKYETFTEGSQGNYTLKGFKETILEALRLVKQPAELELLRRAIAITDQTFTHLCQWLQPGMTEKAIAWEILSTMISLGADALSFESIVASGPNGSMPHAAPSDRRVQRGELITIDMGARYKGYCADMTRTVCLGEPAEPRVREVYDAVLNAMKTCEAGLRAGMSGLAADALSRGALEMEDLAKYYVHGVGHGVGLQIHEGPSLSPRASDELKLPVGCVVTVEPGVYIPGWSGARVEDCVLIKEDGVEVLTQSPTTLVLPR